MPRIDQILLETLTKMVSQITNFVPKLILSLVVFFVGLLIAKIAYSIISKVLKKIQIDKLGEKLNEIDFVKSSKIEISISTVISKITYYFIFMLFISAATETLGVKVITDLVGSIVNMIFPIIASLIMLVIGILIADAIKGIVITACKSLNINSGKILGSVVFFFILAISVIAALGQAGINTKLLESSFNLIIAGVIFAFSFGYGLASKDILSSMLSSFYSKNKYVVGQIIEVDGIKGKIESVDQTTIIINTGSTKTILPLNILQTNKVVIFEN